LAKPEGEPVRHALGPEAEQLGEVLAHRASSRPGAMSSGSTCLSSRGVRAHDEPDGWGPTHETLDSKCLMVADLAAPGSRLRLWRRVRGQDGAGVVRGAVPARGARGP